METLRTMLIVIIMLMLIGIGTVIYLIALIWRAEHLDAKESWEHYEKKSK